MHIFSTLPGHLPSLWLKPSKPKLQQDRTETTPSGENPKHAQLDLSEAEGKEEEKG